MKIAIAIGAAALLAAAAPALAAPLQARAAANRNAEHPVLEAVLADYETWILLKIFAMQFWMFGNPHRSTKQLLICQQPLKWQRLMYSPIKSSGCIVTWRDGIA